MKYYTNHLSLSGYFNESSEKHLAHWIVWAHSHCIAPIFIATDKAEEVGGFKDPIGAIHTSKCQEVEDVDLKW